MNDWIVFWDDFPRSEKVHLNTDYTRVWAGEVVWFNASFPGAYPYELLLEKLTFPAGVMGTTWPSFCLVLLRVIIFVNIISGNLFGRRKLDVGFIKLWNGKFYWEQWNWKRNWNEIEIGNNTCHHLLLMPIDGK